MRQQIRAHLEANGKIDAFEACMQYGCFDLRRVIYDLALDGYTIIAEPGKAYETYYLERG